MSKSKKKKVKDRKQKRAARPSLPRHLEEGLSEAEEYLDHGEWEESLDVLQSLEKRYPRSEEVLLCLYNVYLKMEDDQELLNVCRRLHGLRPKDPEIILALGESYMNNFFPFLSCRTFQQFLEQWPNHPEAEKVRELLEETKSQRETLLAELGVQGEEGRELAERHEEVQCLTAQRDYAASQRMAEQLIADLPNFLPAWNNLSLACFAAGDLDSAIDAARKVLQIAPDNYHALANLAHYLFLRGRTDEARTTAERLKNVSSPQADIWIKKAEVFSLFGDDETVLEILHGAEAAGQSRSSVHAAYLYHLAAVAAYRLDRESEAMRYWEEAEKLQPGCGEAEDNLKDLEQPVGERHAAWPFSLAQWISEKTLRQLTSYLRGPSRQPLSEEAARQQAQRFFLEHPEMNTILSALLDRGDPVGREFAMRIASLAKTPEMLAALRDFAFGRRGPDQMRLDAASSASQAGLLPSGEKVRIWREGQWTEILLIGFEIHEEPIQKHSPKVLKLAQQVHKLLLEGNAEEAERLLRQALAVEPNALDLLNNLASAYQMQGRKREAEQLFDDIFRRDPDYLFARVSIAIRHIRNKELDKARELLLPLMSRKRLHFSGFTVLAIAQIELALAENNRESARCWLEMWEDVYPDHPALPGYQRRVEGNKGWPWPFRRKS